MLVLLLLTEKIGFLKTKVSLTQRDIGRHIEEVRKTDRGRLFYPSTKTLIVVEPEELNAQHQWCRRDAHSS